jgi:tRNA(Ile)-lysidine synthase
VLKKNLNTDHVIAFAEQNNLLPANASIVVGLSGGADSVYLLHILCQLRKQHNFTLIAAHLNHGWRAQADAEEEFCRAVAQELNVAFESKRLSDIPSLPKYNGSREEFARFARRHFLESVHAQYNADVIALAHHAQDQTETFFIRLMRGASLTGLVGMRAQSGIYIRPLLNLDPVYIRTELCTANIAYVEDASNASPEFLRNRIRHNALPALRSCDNRFDTNFGQTLDRLQKTEDILTEFTEALFATMSSMEDSHLWVDLKKLCSQHTIVQHRLLIHWLCKVQVPFSPTEAFLQELLRFLCSDRGGTHYMHAEWYVRKVQHRAYISMKQ